ncbi:MAG TPA: ABC transporter permease [Thermoanaerobaculia bacterium]|nr:ABC transporter permease [Thermoanaerobaculia bacterium]
MSAILADVRHALRTFRSRPAFTLAAVLTLALGIGANSAIFSLAEALLLRPLPYREPASLVVATNHVRTFNADIASGADYLDWQEQSRQLSAVEAFDDSASFTLTGSEQPERLRGARVSQGLLSLLGITPASGRGFHPEEGRLNGPPAVILSAPLAERLFGSAPKAGTPVAGGAAAMGKLLRLDGRAFPVVGVLPRQFVFPGNPGVELLVPLQLDSAREHGLRQMSILTIVGRLRPGATLDLARGELQAIRQRAEAAAIAADLAGPPAAAPAAPPPAGPRFGPSIQIRIQAGPGGGPGAGPGARRMLAFGSEVRVTPLHEKLVGKVRPGLLLLASAVGLVLLIACANVAHLLLARAAARRRELAIRAALGANHGRLVRHLLTESVLLALAGGTAGLLVAAWGSRLLAALAPGEVAGALLPQVAVGLDASVLLFTLALVLATSLLFGLGPALAAAHVELREPLQAIARAGQGRVRGLLVAAEVALATILLVGAGLLLRSFARLQAVDPGFRPERVLTLALDLSSSGVYREPAAQTAFMDELARRVAALPGVRSVAFGDSLPLARVLRMLRGLAVENRPPRDPWEEPEVTVSAVSPDYFRTLGIALRRGRAFDARDAATAPPVAVVSHTLARSFWGDADPIGKRIRPGPPGRPWVTVVGEVKDVRREDLATAPKAELYFPYLQQPSAFAFLALRTRDDPAAQTGAVRREIHALDAQLPAFDISTLEQRLAASIAARRFGLLLISAFAVLALALAAVGLAGVVAYGVVERTREIGVRMALGARRGHVLSLVVGNALLAVAAGIVAGIPAAMMLSRFLAGALYGIAATDPMTYLAIPVLLLAISFLAAYLPARRAAQVDPLVALRHD